MYLLSDTPGWKDITAVRNGDVYILDGNQYFNRPGPRVAESLEIFAEIFPPEVCNFGYEGAGWKRYQED